MNIDLIIDRFNGKYAILDSQDKTLFIFNFTRYLLPQETKGDTVLIFYLSIDQKETKEKRRKYRTFLMI